MLDGDARESLKGVLARIPTAMGSYTRPGRGSSAWIIQNTRNDIFW